MASGSSETQNTVVVLAVDGSDHSEYTFNWYVQHVYRPTHALHVIHVPEYWGHLGRVMSHAKVHELVQQTKQQTENMKTQYLQWCAQHGVKDAKFAHPHAHGQDAWHEIIKYAEKVGAGMIVIGSRGQGKLRRTLMGSVSDSVMHHSHVPVLVCRKKLPND